MTIIHEGKGFKLSGTDWIYSDAITSLFYELHECCVYYYENKGWEKYMYPGARDALSDWITSGIRVTVVAGEFPVDYAARVLENNEFSPDIETDDVATTFRPLSISSKEIDYHAKIRKIDTTLYVVTEMHEAKGLYGCGRAVVTLDRSGYLEKKCFWSGYGIQITSLSDIEIGEPINAYLQSEAHQ